MSPRNCPKCGVVGEFIKWGKTKEKRARYKCQACGKTFTQRTGTPRYKTQITERQWKEISKLWGLRTCPCGSDMGRLFGKHPRTGQRYVRKMRKMLPLAHTGPPLGGVVEIDESIAKKQWILGVKERNRKQVRLQTVPNRTMETLNPLVNRQLTYNATALTDEWGGYGLLKYDRPHYTVCHERGFVSEHWKEVHTNGIEGVWGHMKPLAWHTYRGFPYLPEFLRETCFRLNFSYPERKAFLYRKLFPHFTNTSCT